MPSVPDRIRKLFSKALVTCEECGSRVFLSNYFYHNDSDSKWYEGWFVCETPWCYQENFCSVSIGDYELPSRKPFAAISNEDE